MKCIEKGGGLRVLSELYLLKMNSPVQPLHCKEPEASDKTPLAKDGPIIVYLSGLRKLFGHLLLHTVVHPIGNGQHFIARKSIWRRIGFKRPLVVDQMILFGSHKPSESVDLKGTSPLMCTTLKERNMILRVIARLRPNFPGGSPPCEGLGGHIPRFPGEKSSCSGSIFQCRKNICFAKPFSPKDFPNILYIKFEGRKSMFVVRKLFHQS